MTTDRRARGAVTLQPDRCKGCGFCVEFCPTDVLVMSESFTATGYRLPDILRPEACSGCDLCGWYCPDFAIFGYRSSPA